MVDFTPTAKSMVERIKSGEWTFVQVTTALECMRNDIQQDLANNLYKVCRDLMVDALTKSQSGLDEEQSGRAEAFKEIIRMVSDMEEVLASQRKALTSKLPDPIK